MSDFDRLKLDIAEHYFKLLRPYDKMDKTRLFISRWLDVVKTYSKLPDFIAFDPTLPVLNRIVPRAKGVVLVPYPSIKVSRLPQYTSVFPYYPFRVKLEHKDESCKIGLEFFRMYLDITGIRIVCIYRMWYKEKEIVAELQETYPDIKIYTTDCYGSFCQIMLNSVTRGLKSQSRSIHSADKISRSAVL